MKLGSGVCPVPHLLTHGVNVALGTDGMASNDGNDMFGVLKAGGLLHKLWDLDYERWVGAREAWEMATAGGARALGEPAGLGRLEPGRRADLVLLDLDSRVFTPMSRPLNNIVFGSTTTAVHASMVGGRWVMRDGAATGVDEPAILAEARCLAPGILDRHDPAWAESERLLASVRAGWLAARRADWRTWACPRTMPRTASSAARRATTRGALPPPRRRQAAPATPAPAARAP